MRRALNPGDVVVKLVLMALAFAVAALLLRVALGIGAHVPHDPDEGWNAYLAQAVLEGTPLYPHGLMRNNYPPLSFPLVAAFARITGDAIVAGRILSLAAFLAVTGGIVALLREMGAGVLAALFGGLFFAAALLIASDYVAMNDPQLIGHALQVAGLSFLLPARRQVLPAALLLAAGLFVKHDLVAMPLAATLWLLWQDRRDGLRLAGAGLLFCLAGLAATCLLTGADLLRELASPRVWARGNFVGSAGAFLSWAGPGLLVAAGLGWRRRREPAMRFALLYLGIALLTGGLFAWGDGVDANIFFDATIALALAGGLVLQDGAAAALACAAPLALLLVHTHADRAFSYSEAFAREAPGDIAFVRAHPGPVLCEDLSLCYWAGKAAPVDVFNLSEAFRTGAQNESGLAALIRARHFQAMTFTSLSPFAFGPRLKALVLANYRIHHEDDNGVFLEAR